MAALSEQTLLNSVYTLIEGDATGWTATSDEYLSGRIFANMAISAWEHYLNTRWRDLFTTLTAASTGVKTLTAGTYSYACPTDMVFPCSLVRTVDAGGGVSTYTVVSPEKVAELADDGSNFVYFTGSVKTGFTLNFNPNLSLTTSHTINYEYYKSAATFTAITSTTEMSDPYFIVLYVTALFNKDEDVDLYRDFMNQAMARLENMRTDNLLGYYGNEDEISETLGRSNSGFGY